MSGSSQFCESLAHPPVQNNVRLDGKCAFLRSFITCPSSHPERWMSGWLDGHFFTFCASLAHPAIQNDGCLDGWMGISSHFVLRSPIQPSRTMDGWMGISSHFVLRSPIQNDGCLDGWMGVSSHFVLRLPIQPSRTMCVWMGGWAAITSFSVATHPPIRNNLVQKWVDGSSLNFCAIVAHPAIQPSTQT